MKALGRFFKGLAAMAAVVSMLAAGAFAQGASTAYVPFVVNTDATVTAVQDADTVKMSVTANAESVLILPRGVTSVWNTGGTRGRLNAPVITNSRGNITLRLPTQSYQNAEISLHSVNGKRVLRTKAAASETVSGVSRRNVAPGVYMLSVKGANGNAVTTRLTHEGGNLNISVAFGAESVSPERQLGKKTTAEDGNLEITVSAEGYRDSAYTLRPVVGINGIQVINLDPVSQAQTYTLTVSATPSAGGTVSPAVGAHTYDAGELVTVTATANSGYTFKNWTGASTSTSAAVNIMIDGNKTLTANFQQNDTPQPATYTLTIAATNGGTVSPYVGAHTYDAEGLVAVTATASSGYTFKNWTGASTSTSATVNITMDENKTLTANFQQNDTPQPGNTFVDGRDGKTYKKVTIGTQTWMAENLNRATTNSKCYGGSADNCSKYGRLYNWSDAQTACPADWHLPDTTEWNTLVSYVETEKSCSGCAGKYLKSQSGWGACGPEDSGVSYVCEDAFGFSALPGGNDEVSSHSYYYAGNYGGWWSSTEYNAINIASQNQAWLRNMYYSGENVGGTNQIKGRQISVRCVQDE
jgi:uncharacterized protein (TIGR02145 family)/uncharacterized repeat protein (TIGR02543 family)